MKKGTVAMLELKVNEVHQLYQRGALRAKSPVKITVESPIEKNHAGYIEYFRRYGYLIGEVSLSPESDIYSTDDGKFILQKRGDGFTNLLFAVDQETVVIPDGVKIIEGILSGAKVREVIMPDTVTVIKSFAFPKCRNLENVRFSKNLKDIGQYAFSDCSALEKIELPESLRKIEKGAFEGCTSLYDYNIPGSIQDIEAGAFFHCRELLGN